MFHGPLHCNGWLARLGVAGKQFIINYKPQQVTTKVALQRSLLFARSHGQSDHYYNYYAGKSVT